VSGRGADRLGLNRFGRTHFGTGIFWPRLVDPSHFSRVACLLQLQPSGVDGALLRLDLLRGWARRRRRAGVVRFHHIQQLDGRL